MLGTREATSEWCTETTGARSGCSVLSWARLFFQGGNQYCGVGFLCCKLVTNLPVCLEKWAALICSKSTEKLVAFPYSPTLNLYFPKSTAARILSNSYWCLLAAASPKANSQGCNITLGKVELQFLGVLRIIWEDGMHLLPFMYTVSSPN